jgi:hypothetical protein
MYVIEPVGAVEGDAGAVECELKGCILLPSLMSERTYRGPRKMERPVHVRGRIRVRVAPCASGRISYIRRAVRDCNHPSVILVDDAMKTRTGEVV